MEATHNAWRLLKSQVLPQVGKSWEILGYWQSPKDGYQMLPMFFAKTIQMCRNDDTSDICSIYDDKTPSVKL